MFFAVRGPNLRQHKGWTYVSVNGCVLSLRQHKCWTYASVNGCVLSLRQHKGWTYASVYTVSIYMTLT